MSDEFDTQKARIEAHPTLQAYLASRTKDQLAKLIWASNHRANVFASYDVCRLNNAWIEVYQITRRALGGKNG